MPISNNILAGASGATGGGGGPDQRSLRFNAGDSANLSKTFASGNRRTWTWAAWVKRGAIGTKQIFFGSQGTSDTTYVENYFATDDKLYLRYGYNTVAEVRTTQVFRDVGAWMHILIAFNVTESANADKLKLYINGSQVDDFSTDTRSSFSNQDYGINNSSAHKISGAPNGSGDSLDAYLSDVYMVDGQALTYTAFTEFDTNGVLQPKAYSGTYGTNGFHLDFKDNSSSSALGNDAAGSNNWTVNNLSVAAGAGNDSLRDSPYQIADQTDSGAGGTVVGNYATFNPLNKKSGLTLSDGNLKLAQTGTSEQLPAHSTIQVTSGKWYFECEREAATTFLVGLQNPNVINNYSGVVYNLVDGNTILTNEDGGGAAGQGYVATSGTGINVGIAIDKDNESIKFYRENVLLKTLTTQSWMTSLAIAIYQSGSGFVNYGAMPFKYTAPSGYKALNTASLPTPTIADGSQYFDAKLYAGNSGDGLATTQNITTNFAPAMVWIKSRTDGNPHTIFDTVRGAGKRVQPNSSGAETTKNQTLQSFNTDGFTVNGDNSVNDVGQNYVSWNWAGGTAFSNSAGSNGATVASSGVVNQAAGFSICTYTGTGSAATIGHGLNIVPSMYIIKNRTNAYEWGVYHIDIGTGAAQVLNSSNNNSVSNTWWNNTAPTSSVFSIGTYAAVSQNNSNFVAYCFAPVAGYSAMGSYTGNGSADGPFVSLSFRPAWVMVKSSTESAHWDIIDASRSPHNLQSNVLRADSTTNEFSDTSAQYGIAWDALSNGFKLRRGSATHDVNESGQSYIYLAFAEHPFKTARAR